MRLRLFGSPPPSPEIERGRLPREAPDVCNDGKARGEHIPSGLPPRADIVDALWHFRKVPKLVIAEIAAKQSWNCVRAWTGRP